MEKKSKRLLPTPADGKRQSITKATDSNSSSLWALLVIADMCLIPKYIYAQSKV